MRDVCRVVMKTALFAFILTLSCLLATSTAAAQTNIAILFSNSGNGVLRSCHCPNAPWGGLAKRAWLVNRIRDVAGTENVLLLDSGDFFPPEPDEDKADCLLHLYQLMRYDAVAVGDQELVHVNSSNPPADSNSFPWLSGGYRRLGGSTPGEFIKPPWLIKTVAGCKVGIISVVGHDPFKLSGSKLEGLTLTDQSEIIRSFVKNHGTECDLVIVLSHGGLDSDTILATVISGVDIIIGGHSQSLISPPEVVNGIPICQAGKNGENLGLIVLTPAPKAVAIPAGSNQISRIRNPFAPYRVSARRWAGSYQVLPLNSQVDEDPAAAAIINGYYARHDEKNVENLADNSHAGQDAPALIMEKPVQYTVARYGEKQQFHFSIRNVGNSPLVIQKARSKIRWLKVLDCTAVVPAGGTGELSLELSATNIDRFFRSEFTLTTSDSRHRVAGGTINGRIDGPIDGIVDVPLLLAGAFIPAFRDNMHEDDPSESTNRSSQVLVEFFYSAGCADCAEMESSVLPELRNRFGAAIDLRHYDVNDLSNYLRLVRLQEKLEVRTSENVSIYIDGIIHLGGLKTIRRELHGKVAELAASKSRNGGTAPSTASPEIPTAGGSESEWTLLVRRIQNYSVWSVGLIGLADGLNPCAFATIIFFITMLSVTGVSGRRLLLVGIGFALASFITYLLIGLGAMQILRTLTAYHFVSKVLKWVMIAGLTTLSAISFRDAWKFNRTGRAADVSLQLPAVFKRRIHEIMRTRLAANNLFAGSLVMGFLVTLLESVCTGQMLLPTLVFLTRHPTLSSRAWPLLVFYNLMFIVPLIVVMIAAYFGAKNQFLMEWSRRNVVPSKIIMALFFAAMTIAMIFF